MEERKYDADNLRGSEAEVNITVTKLGVIFPKSTRREKTSFFQDLCERKPTVRVVCQGPIRRLHSRIAQWTLLQVQYSYSEMKSAPFVKRY